MFLPTSPDKKSIMFFSLRLVTTNEVRKIFVIAVYNLGGALQWYTMIRGYGKHSGFKAAGLAINHVDARPDRIKIDWKALCPSGFFEMLEKGYIFQENHAFSRRLTRFETSIFGIRDFKWFFSNLFSFGRFRVCHFLPHSPISRLTREKFDKGKERKFLMDCVNKIWLLSFIFGQEYHIVLSWRH